MYVYYYMVSSLYLLSLLIINLSLQTTMYVYYYIVSSLYQLSLLIINLLLQTTMYVYYYIVSSLYQLSLTQGVKNIGRWTQQQDGGKS